jgi:hypothetical protein
MMLQIKKRGDSSRGIRLMTTLCFYQDTRHERELIWIQNTIDAGYVSARNDGMSELRIQGFERVQSVLTLLAPFIRFKRVQCKALMEACELLIRTPLREMEKNELKKLVTLILTIQQANYATRKKRSKKELCELLGLTP